MYVDASAIVAILAPEDDGPALAARLETAQEPVTSSLTVFETVMALRRLRKASVSEVLFTVHGFLERAGIGLIGVAPDQHISALKAHERYGKGSGNPANLNMGDCFAYAMAQKRGVSLLYKGNDFSFTDLR